MPRLNDPNTNKVSLMEIEEDLPWLACRAALELDNLILDRHKGFDAVPKLIKRIATPLFPEIETKESSEQQAAYLDPTAMVMVHRAIEVSELTLGRILLEGKQRPITRVNELLANTKEIVALLNSVVDTPEKCRENQKQELENMRSFCLALSKSASAREPLYDEYQKPFEI